MSERTALLIHCSKAEAAGIRRRGELDDRSVSRYILRILMRAVDFEENLFLRQHRLTPLDAGLLRQMARPRQPRTAVLVRCSREEAERIRIAAKRRDTTISGFVLYTLHKYWEVTDRYVRG